MSTAHPLRDIERIDGPPGPYLKSIGTIFATFGAPAQDSGNVSYGVQVGGERFFVKTTNPEAEAFGDHATRGALLYNAARLRRSWIIRPCDHATRVALLYGGRDDPQAQLRSSDLASGIASSKLRSPALVYDWVDRLYGARRSAIGASAISPPARRRHARRARRDLRFARPARPARVDCRGFLRWLSDVRLRAPSRAHRGSR